MSQIKLLTLFVYGAVMIGGIVIAKKPLVSCRDESGQEVDWYYLYKLPKHHTRDGIKNTESGFKYLSITSQNLNSWQLSEKEITSPDSIPAITLQPLFNDNNILLLAYNDQFPNGTVFFSRAHAKGVFATDGERAMWLIHSVPKFPAIPEYAYPSTGGEYGQSFLCLSLPATEVDKVATQFTYMALNIYYVNAPEKLRKRFPILEQVLQHQWRSRAPYHNQMSLETIAGEKFRSFAKNSKNKMELYEEFLAPELDVNLLVETWRNGPGNLASNCSLSEKVFNIIELMQPQFKIGFKTTSDHSKWAVSQDTGFKFFSWRIGGSDWICVGDINRQESQRQRGGGSVCFEHSKVAKLYRQMISSYESCNL